MNSLEYFNVFHETIFSLVVILKFILNRFRGFEDCLMCVCTLTHKYMHVHVYKHIIYTFTRNCGMYFNVFSWSYFLISKIFFFKFLNDFENLKINWYVRVHTWHACKDYFFFIERKLLLPRHMMFYYFHPMLKFDKILVLW